MCKGVKCNGMSMKLEQLELDIEFTSGQLSVAIQISIILEDSPISQQLIFEPWLTTTACYCLNVENFTPFVVRPGLNQHRFK